MIFPVGALRSTPTRARGGGRSLHTGAATRLRQERRRAVVTAPRAAYTAVIA
jgi:hypothetical protein